MNSFDCNKCMHKNVCQYKEQVPEYNDRESDSMFELTISCKEYKEERPVPRTFDPPIVAPYNQGWATGTSSQGTECQAYRTYLNMAKDTNWVGDSPCSYCLKTDCPLSHLTTCSNASTSNPIK